MVKKSLLTKLIGIGTIATAIALSPSQSYEDTSYFSEPIFIEAREKSTEMIHEERRIEEEKRKKEDMVKKVLAAEFDIGKYTSEQAIKIIEKGISHSGELPPYMDVGYLFCIINNESGGNPKAKSKKGARGWFQLMPETWKDYNPRTSFDRAYDPEENTKTAIKAINGNEAYFEEKHPRWNALSTEEKLELHAAAYNWGKGNLRRIGWDLNKKKRIPFETRKHIKEIMKDYRNLAYQDI